MFHQLLPDETHLNDLFKFLEKKVVKTGDYLMRQKDAPDDIYFVESGQVTAQLEYTNQAPVRLETMKSGRVIGELAFFGQEFTDLQWFSDQLSFLETHTYFTASARALLDAGQAKNIVELKKKLEESK
jgi:CRP-like cAMP-binding protein